MPDGAWRAGSSVVRGIERCPKLIFWKIYILHKNTTPQFPVTDMPRYELEPNLVKVSKSNNFTDAVKEWFVETPKPQYEIGQQCACGRDINKFYIVRNLITEKKQFVRLGSGCVNHIKKIHPNFKSTGARHRERLLDFFEKGVYRTIDDMSEYCRQVFHDYLRRIQDIEKLHELWNDYPRHRDAITSRMAELMGTMPFAKIKSLPSQITDTHRAAVDRRLATLLSQETEREKVLLVTLLNQETELEKVLSPRYAKYADAVDRRVKELIGTMPFAKIESLPSHINENYADAVDRRMEELISVETELENVLSPRYANYAKAVDRRMEELIGGMRIDDIPLMPSQISKRYRRMVRSKIDGYVSYIFGKINKIQSWENVILDMKRFEPVYPLRLILQKHRDKITKSIHG